MVLDKLGSTLKKTTDRIVNAIFLDKNMVDSIVRDLQRSLIEADVNVRLVKDITSKIKKAAKDERIKEVDKKEHLIKLLHDELLNILGESKELDLEKTSEKEGEQNKVMLIGLYGSGKTTSIAKLGNYYQKRGKKVALLGLDVHRPAAKQQLEQMAERNNLNCFTWQEKSSGKPETAEEAYQRLEKSGKLKKYDLLLIDTAGRHNLDEELVKEIKGLDKTIKPTETALVIPADIGQAAKDQASQFQEALDISGVIITRMDSTAKAGGALTACSETQAGVYFITTGERINDIESFNPESFLSRLLGMGDLQGLIEKVQSATDSGKQKQIQEKVKEGKISLEDVVEQVKAMNSMGGMGKIKDMLPGMGGNKEKIPDEALEGQQDKIAKWEHIVKSMTPEEKENPEILEKENGTSRVNRISKGSGATNKEVKSLLKQYKMLQGMMKEGGSEMQDLQQGQLSQKQMQKLARKFGKNMKF